MGVVSANGVKAWWSSCGVPEIGENFEGKKAEGRLVAEGGGEKVLQGVGKQPLQTYLDRRQAKLAEWVVLWPIFDVCKRETGYERGGKIQVPWWR